MKELYLCVCVCVCVRVCFFEVWCGTNYCVTSNNVERGWGTSNNVDRGVWHFIITYLQILKPMMLRRLKEDVEKSLAAKEETIIEVQK